MLFGYGHQIDEIKDALEELVEIQKKSVRNLKAEIEKISNEKSEQLRLAKDYIRDMVILGDDANYAKLGRTIREAGATYNFPELIANWRTADKANREEKENLLTKHGTQSQVRERMAALGAEISVIKEALGEMKPEIEAFDEATVKIEQHNQKYPKLVISEGMHDDYENFSLLRWLGYYTFINRAPHSAYRALGEYTAQYGDYYEDARDIAKLRANEDEQENTMESLQTKLKSEQAIDNRMSQLDREYRGPEGIAREIRQRIFDFMRTDDDYADILFDRGNFAPAKNAALCLAKAEALESLHATVHPFLKNAEDTLEDLQSPVKKISNVPHAVMNERVNFDLDGLSREVRNAADSTRAAEHATQKARIAMDEFQPRGHETYDDVKRALRNEVKLGYEDNQLSLNFITLNNSIGNAVDEYEAEQERQRQAKIRADRAAREALRDSFDTASKVRTRRTNHSVSRSSSIGVGSRTRTRSTSVSAGTKGLSGGPRGRR